MEGLWPRGGELRVEIRDKRYETIDVYIKCMVYGV